MKKYIIILVITIVTLSFFLSRNIINDISIGRSTRIELQNNDPAYLLRMEKEENNKYQNLSDDINRLAVENNLNAYVVSESIDNLNGNSITLYVSENMKFLKNYILLKSSEFETKETYSSNDLNIKNRIFTIFSSDTFRVEPLVNENNEGTYVIINQNGDYLSNLKKFKGQLSKIYQNENLILNKYFESSERRENLFKINSIVISSSFLLVIASVMAVYLFSLRREISLRKAMGYSDFEIFNQMILKCFLNYTLGGYFLLLIFSTIFFYFNQYSILVKALTINCFLLSCLTVIYLSLSYFTIKYIPIADTIRGKSDLRAVMSLSITTKVFLTFLLVPQLSIVLAKSIELGTVIYRENKIINAGENLFAFGGQYPTNYTEEIGTSNAIKLFNEINSEHNMIECNDGILIDYKDMSQQAPVIFIDESYMKKHGSILNYNKFNNIILFYNKEDIFDINYYLDLIGQYYEIDRRKIQTVEYQKLLPSCSFNSILENDKIQNMPLLYIPKQSGYEGQFNSKYIEFAGNLTDLQEIINNKFIKFGYAPQFKMLSIEQQYKNATKNIIINNVESILPIFLWIITLFIANNFIVNIDLAMNRKYYQIKETEGERIFKLLRYLKVIIVPSAIAIMMLALTNKLRIIDLLIFCILELICICYLLFYYNWKRGC